MKNSPISRKRWNRDEINALVNGIIRYGYNWHAIKTDPDLRIHLFHRDIKAIKNAWRKGSSIRRKHGEHVDKMQKIRSDPETWLEYNSRKKNVVRHEKMDVVECNVIDEKVNECKSETKEDNSDEDDDDDDDDDGENEDDDEVDFDYILKARQKAAASSSSTTNQKEPVERSSVSSSLSSSSSSSISSSSSVSSSISSSLLSSTSTIQDRERINPESIFENIAPFKVPYKKIEVVEVPKDIPIITIPNTKIAVSIHVGDSVLMSVRNLPQHMTDALETYRRDKTFDGLIHIAIKYDSV